MKWPRAAIGLIGLGSLLIVSALAVGISVNLGGEEIKSRAAIMLPNSAIAVGNLAPDFELQSLDGGIYSLASLQGKPVVLNFWASWCPPCKEEMPLLQEYVDRYGDHFTILAVDYGESGEVVRAFVEELDMTFPILLDPGNEVNTLYRIQAYPTTYFISAEGTIVDFQIGLLSEANLKAYLGSLDVIK